jgi:hypothetical protein
MSEFVYWWHHADSGTPTLAVSADDGARHQSGINVSGDRVKEAL